jgi:hypothetical protein
VWLLPGHEKSALMSVQGLCRNAFTVTFIAAPRDNIQVSQARVDKGRDQVRDKGFDGGAPEFRNDTVPEVGTPLMPKRSGSTTRFDRREASWIDTAAVTPLSLCAQPDFQRSQLNPGHNQGADH